MQMTSGTLFQPDFCLSSSSIEKGAPWTSMPDPHRTLNSVDGVHCDPLQI